MKNSACPELRQRLVPFRRLQLFTRRLQRRRILVWDWATALELGYTTLGGEDLSHLLRLARR